MPSWPGLPDDAADQRNAPDRRQDGTSGWPGPLLLLTALLGGLASRAAEIADGMRAGDWDEFRALVIGRHRVAPPVGAALRLCGLTLPDEIEAAIRAEARANGFAALAQKRESLRLAEKLDATGVRAIWLKGWPLAEQLYGGTGQRHANDIDVLVAADQRIAAARCLEELGYRPAAEHALRSRLIRLSAVRNECKDVNYVHHETGMLVELHWRASHFRGWPEYGDMGEPAEIAPGAADHGISVPGPVEQLVYLSGHGVQHLFGRLKWLLDIHRLTEWRGVDKLGEDLARAEAAGAGRPVRLSLHLAHRVFGANVPAAARELAPAEARWADQILQGIGDPRAEPGRPKARIGFYTWHLRLAEGPVQMLGVLRYALWRRLRLRLAGLTHRNGGSNA